MKDNCKTLMVQGTTSDAGKSILVAGLCRLFAREGNKVAPFKPQNMALNSAVTRDGGEIGRAQALQAQACGVSPHTDFNPVLLKPNTDTGAQVIIQGKAISANQGNMDAATFHDYKQIAMSAVLDSYGRLQQGYQYIFVEGAGSPAEINLRDRDIANMGFAETADCPVIIIADIDRGGVFAHLVGTLMLLSESEQQRVKGFVINRFRGDIALLESGLTWLEQETAKPVLAVLPYIHDLQLDAEDAIDASQRRSEEENVLKVVVPVLTRISNHTDFDPLRLHPGVDLEYVRMGQPLPAADLIILPGSKSVRADLAFLREQGWDQQLLQHLRYGGKVMGICGGYQMLGEYIWDPLGLEGPAGESRGLGLLALSTELAADKQLKQTRGQLLLGESAVAITGYEIHAGHSQGAALARPLMSLMDQSGNSYPDGAISEDGQIIGGYLHGLFDQPQACEALLAWAGMASQPAPDLNQIREQQLDALADILEQHFDREQLNGCF